MYPAYNFSEHLKETLGKGNLCRFAATGYSMSPFIKDNDELIVAPVSRHMPRLGDIVAYAHPLNRKLYVHRIVGRNREGFIIKGDNLFSIDGVIPLDAILGVAIHIERKGSRRTASLGWERAIIALLSRVRVFPLIMYPLRRLILLSRRSK